VAERTGPYEHCDGTIEQPCEYPVSEDALHEYGLGFDYVPAGTFSDQDEPFFRWQLSTGGPGDEFRFFTGPDLVPHRVEYWFLDWWDGASRRLHGPDKDTLLEFWSILAECGVPAAEVERASE
jgi:hypothetical protein